NNANDILIRAIEKAKQLQPSNKPNLVMQEMRGTVGTFASNKFMNAMQQNTISLTTLRSGVGDPPKVNVIPSVAEATLDCRLLPGTTAAQWTEEVERRLAYPTIKIDVSNAGAHPAVSPQDTTMYRALESAIERRHPDAIVTP